MEDTLTNVYAVMLTVKVLAPRVLFCALGSLTLVVTHCSHGRTPSTAAFVCLWL